LLIVQVRVGPLLPILLEEEMELRDAKRRRLNQKVADREDWQLCI
jgi:hypothetical protein